MTNTALSKPTPFGKNASADRVLGEDDDTRVNQLFLRQGTQIDHFRRVVNKITSMRRADSSRSSKKISPNISVNVG